MNMVLKKLRDDQEKTLQYILYIKYFIEQNKIGDAVRYLNAIQVDVEDNIDILNKGVGI